MIHSRFPASLDHLYQMLSFIREFVEGMGFNTSDLSKIELAAEEAIVNIISYGYSSHQGNIEITCQSPNPETVHITIKDDGIPYNPVANHKEKSKLDLNNCTVGGYGIYFIVKIMDDVKYTREDNSNVLMLVKRKKN